MFPCKAVIPRLADVGSIRGTCLKPHGRGQSSAAEANTMFLFDLFMYIFFERFKASEVNKPHMYGHVKMCRGATFWMRWRNRHKAGGPHTPQFRKDGALLHPPDRRRE